MNPEAQRIAIAEACGWKRVHFEDKRFEQWPDFAWRSPDGKSQLGFSMLPDYLNDLNAMREAEGVLTEDQREEYCALLLSEDPYPESSSRWSCAHATATQRAEAFLRTIGKGRGE